MKVKANNNTYKVAKFIMASLGGSATAKAVKGIYDAFGNDGIISKIGEGFVCMAVGCLAFEAVEHTCDRFIEFVDANAAEEAEEVVVDVE